MNYVEACKLTYEAGKQAMDKAIPRIAGGIASTNMLMKSQAVNAVISAVNNHRMQVYPMTEKEIEDQWRTVRKALWTTSFFWPGEYSP